MQKGGNMREVFTRFCNGLNKVEDAIKKKGGILLYVIIQLSDNRVLSLDTFRPGIYVERTPWLHLDLSIQPWHWIEGWCSCQATKTITRWKVVFTSWEAQAAKAWNWYVCFSFVPSYLHHCMYIPK